MVSKIIAMAKSLLGEPLPQSEEEPLTRLSQAAFDEWNGRLLPEITPENCADALVLACAWTALSGLVAAREAAEPFLAFTAGELSVSYGKNGREDTASRLLKQAERLMAPYTRDNGFFFRGVRG